MKTVKSLACAGILAAAFYGAAFHEFPIAMTGDVSPNCNTDEVYDYRAHEIHGMEHSHLSERYYLCDDDLVHDIYLNTGAAQYHIGVTPPLPHTEEKQAFRMGDRATVRFNATLWEQFRDYRNRENAKEDPLYPYILHKTYGDKPFNVAPDAITVIPAIKHK